MNSFKSSYNSMKLAYWLVITTIIFLPWMAMSNAIPLLTLLILFVFRMVLKGIKGVTFVVMAIAICLPFIANMNEGMSLFFANHFKWLNRAIYLSILFVFIFCLFKRTKAQGIPVLALVLTSVGMFADSLRFSYDEAMSVLYVILTVPVVFYISYRGKENWNDLFHMFNVYFIGIAVYAIFDFFFRMGPYVPLRMGTLSFYADFFRTGSLLGNSLLLTGFLMAYHTILLIDYFLTNRLSTWLVITSILILLLTGSRTAFIVLIAIWFMFTFYLNRGVKVKIRTITIMTFVFFALAFIVYFFFNNYATMFLNRFLEGSEHRQSGYQTMLNIFSANPMGVGINGTEDAFILYSADGWSAGMKTVDNVYLTLFITSGIFFFLPFLFYFFIPINAYFRSRLNRNYRIVVMLFASYILCGMTFNINSFIQMNILYFGIAGHMYRLIQNNNNNGLVNNHCKL